LVLEIFSSIVSGDAGAAGEEDLLSKAAEEGCRAIREKCRKI
jgi:hypothetical protein